MGWINPKSNIASREATCICMLSRLFSDSDIICENDLCEQRKCCTFVAVSGLMPDIVKQVADLLLCLVPWEQLLLPLGHQWEGSFVFRSKEEEKEISICFEKECKKKSRVFEEQAWRLNFWCLAKWTWFSWRSSWKGCCWESFQVWPMRKSNSNLKMVWRSTLENLTR